MKCININQSDLKASQAILGMMRISSLNDIEIRVLVETALELGINCFDHADIYGGTPHHCETRFGDAMKLDPSSRERIIIQSKAGIRSGYFDFSQEHLISSVEKSLSALKTDYLDLFLLHRPDTLMEPDEVASAFDKLHSSGKVRYFGVSNHTPLQIKLLKTCVAQPIIVNQIQLSITHAPLITQGLAMNMMGAEQSTDRTLGLLEWSRCEGMTLQAWSPFQKKFFDGTFIGDRENYSQLNNLMDDLAASYNITPTGIAASWIARHPAAFQLVLGTTNQNRLKEVVSGLSINLSRKDWYDLYTAAGHLLP